VPPVPRRRFLQGGLLQAGLGFLGGAAGGGLLPGGRNLVPTVASEPFPRVAAPLRGLSLAAYSLRDEFAWVDGRPTGKQLDLFGFLDYCAQLGLQGAEITSYYFEAPLTAAGVHALKRRATLLGLDITGGAVRNNFSWTPGSAEARAEVRQVCDWIDRYADLGAPTIRVFAGVDPTGRLDEQQTIDHVAANLEAALQHAERRGVLLGLENHDFTQRVGRLEAILSKVDSDWLGVTWDSGNVEAASDPYAELQRIAPRAVTAQIKARVQVAGASQPADFARLANLLRQAGYCGYLVLEYEENAPPREAIPGLLRELRKALG